MLITQNKHKTQSKGHYSEMKKAKRTVIVLDTLSCLIYIPITFHKDILKGNLVNGAYNTFGINVKKIIKGALLRNG